MGGGEVEGGLGITKVSGGWRESLRIGNVSGGGRRGPELETFLGDPPQILKIENYPPPRQAPWLKVLSFIVSSLSRED